MKTPLVPTNIHSPFARYSHAVAVDGATRLLFASGQLGVSTDGQVPDSAGEQAAVCFSNIDAILAEGGMDRSAVVRINAFVTAREHLKGYMAVRDNWIAPLDIPPASTLVIVAGFTRPEFKVEVEVVAAAVR